MLYLKFLNDLKNYKQLNSMENLLKLILLQTQEHQKLIKIKNYHFFMAGFLDLVTFFQVLAGYQFH